MESGNFVGLEFVVKGMIQYEIINVKHISRIMFIGDKTYIGMIGSTFTRQLSLTSCDKLAKFLNISEA